MDDIKLCCKICYEKYNLANCKPMILIMCCHSVCLRCLDELCKQHNFNCPICREKVYDFKPSYDIIELLEGSNHSKFIGSNTMAKHSKVIDQVKRINSLNRKDHFLISGPVFFIKSKKYGKYLNGGSNHMDSADSGRISDWIKWRIKMNKDGYYFIQCKQNNGFLDGGENHIRSIEHGTDNSDWIKWKIIPNDDGFYFIQCKQHNGYLDSGLKHIRQSEIGIGNSDFISWKLAQ